MKTKGVIKNSGKPFIIANPIYDTVFKKMMENQRIAKFFLSTILEQPIYDLVVLPQEFIYRLDDMRVLDKIKEKKEKFNKRKKKEKDGVVEYFSFFRLDFVATIRDSDGKPRKILVELQKSWDILDIVRFRRYLGEQYIRVDKIDGEETVLPMTTIYILGNNLSEIDCPCIKVERIYTDMLNKETINVKSKFIENLSHDCYVIQAGRITDVRYSSNLDKLLSIFEQRYFVTDNSDTRKEYPYQPDDEEMKLITDLLYEMGANPEERKQIESEEEFLRVINNMKDPLKKSLKEKDKKLEEQDKKLKKQAKSLKEKNKSLKEKDKSLKEKDKSLKEKAKSLKEKDKKLEEKDKKLEEKDKENAELREKYAKLERLIRDKQLE